MRAYPTHLYNLQSLIPQQQQQMRQQVPWFQAHSSQTYLDNLGTRSDDDESLSVIGIKQTPIRSRVNSTGGIGTRGRSRTLPSRAAMFPESIGPIEPQVLQPPSMPRESNSSTSMDLSPQQRVLTLGMNFSSSSSDYDTVGPSTAMSLICKDKASPTLLPPHDTAVPTPYYMSKTEPNSPLCAPMLNTIESADNALDPAATLLMLPAPPKNSCPLCDKTFTRPFNLKSHLLAHANKKPFACDAADDCGSRFTRRTDWVRHIRAKHPLYDWGQKEGKGKKKNEDDEGEEEEVVVEKKDADDMNAENELKKEVEDGPSIEQKTNVKDEERD
ncbi:hypothetical protein BG011_002979 [Mortierella polycephala]|uniref:C2H2-type domain-containing protein n=1 Tax=Mortierella polycephala TaxID=41804 RepID=A0A9P6Q3B3_9FUNG|nr:hypothetical protein BG011_002979 [Mortierella polycephala]